MKFVKKFSMITSLLALMLMLSVSMAQAQDTVQLRYVLWVSNQQPAYQACADEFTKRNPNITISIEQAGWSEYWDGLTTSLVSGTAPDVFTDHIAHYPELLSKGQLLDIQPYVDQDKVDTSIYLVDPSLWVKDGKRYGLPKDWDTIALFYNQDAFSKGGITADDIANWTWNPDDGGTFQQSIAKLTLDANGKNGFDPAFDKSNVVQWGFEGGPGDASRSLLERGERRTRRLQGLGTHRRDRRPSRCVHLLLDEETALARAHHLTAVGRERAREQPQQRALSGAVVADHGQALPGADGKRDAVEHGAVAESLAQLAGPEMQPRARGGRRQSADHPETHDVPS